METIHTYFLTFKDKEEILALWNAEYPESLEYKRLQEFENYLGELIDPYHILIKNDDGAIKAWYFDFIREKERWFATIIASEWQGKSYGTELISMAKQKRSELNGWVINDNTYRKASGEMYRSPVGFYRKNGFKVLEEVKLVTDKLSAIKIEWKKQRIE